MLEIQNHPKSDSLKVSDETRSTLCDKNIFLKVTPITCDDIKSRFNSLRNLHGFITIDFKLEFTTYRAG